MSNIYNLISNTYPNNVVPQFTDPLNSGTCQNTLRCKGNSNAKFIVINENNISVIQGWEVKTFVELNEFFVPVTSYLESEIEIPNHINLDYTVISSDIGGGNIASFIMIFPQYINTGVDDQNLWWLNWRYTGEDAWKKFGRILLINVEPDGLIPPIEIKNSLGVSINFKILFGK